MTAKKGRTELMEFLKNNNIQSKVIEHPAVFTVETMMEHLTDIEGHVTKNLFLKDKKKKLYLLSAVHSQDIKLNDICKKVGAANSLRFADENTMIEKLNVAQGCCTPLSLINDTEKDVRFIADSRLLEAGTMVYSHPMENTVTLGMSTEHFKEFLSVTGHEPIIIDFSA